MGKREGHSKRVSCYGLKEKDILFFSSEVIVSTEVSVSSDEDVAISSEYVFSDLAKMICAIRVRILMQQAHTDAIQA